MGLVHHQPVIRPGNSEVHGDLQGLLAVYHLAHLPDGEGVVDVHGLPLVVKQEGRLLLVIIFGEAPGQFFWDTGIACLGVYGWEQVNYCKEHNT